MGGRFHVRIGRRQPRHPPANTHAAALHAPDRDPPHVVRVVEGRDQHLERAGGVGGRRGDAPDHRLEERGQIRAAAIRFGRGPAVPSCGVEKGRIELGVACVQVHEEFQDLVVHLPGARVGAVHLVDEDHRRQPERERLGRHEPRLRHGTLGGVDQQEHPIHHPQNALHLPAEVGVSRRIDDVDLGAAPQDRRVLGEDGDAALALQRIRVQDSLADFLAGAKDPGLAKHLVDQRGLAMIHMRYDGNVAQLRGRQWGRHRLVGRPRPPGAAVALITPRRA